MFVIDITQSYSGKHKIPVTANKRLELKMTDDGLQEVKNSIGKLDDTLRTKIFYELSETNEIFLIRYWMNFERIGLGHSTSID